jgi:uncharacterized membrane protein
MKGFPMRWAIGAMTFTSLAAMAVSALSQPSIPKPLQVLVSASGTEPFWQVSVTRQGIEYRTPEQPTPLKFAYSAPIAAQGRPTDVVQVYRLQSRSVNGWLMIQKAGSEKCSDGMSDNQYPYSAIVMLNGKVRSGCASTLADPMTQTENGG